MQWSDVGVAAANKFLQKIWDLNFNISNKKHDTSDKIAEKNFNDEVNDYILKIDKSINQFRFNVSIALFYELYNFLNHNLDNKISSKTQKTNMINVMKLMIPFVPHLARECLDLLKCSNPHSWPKVDSSKKLNKIKFAIQINGKTRDILTINENTNEKDITKIVLKSSKAKKYIENKKITKTIFVKNKIINYILNN